MSRFASRLPEALLAASLCSVLRQLLIVERTKESCPNPFSCVAIWWTYKNIETCDFCHICESLCSLFMGFVAAVPSDSVYLHYANSLFARTTGASTRVSWFIQGTALFLELLRVLESAQWVEAPKMCSAVCARIPPKWQR